MPPLSGGRVLTFHSIGHRSHPTNVQPEVFQEMMAWLAEHHAVRPLAEIASGEEGVAITFDDGYRDNLTEAAPVLETLGLPAAVFVVSQRVGGRLEHDQDDPYAALLSWEEIAELRSMGWTIGAHSRTHARLTELDEAGQRDEIMGSVKDVFERIGGVCDIFAYPYGSALDFDETSQRLVAEANCAFAFSNRFRTITGEADHHALPRINIDASDTIETFRAKVMGRLDALRWLEGEWAAKMKRSRRLS